MLEAARHLWEGFSGIPHIKTYLASAYFLYLLALSFWIILQKREPVATLTWVLVLAVFPYIGFLIYYLLGPQRIKRHRLRRVRSRLETDKTLHSPSSPTYPSTGLFPLAQAVTGIASGTATDIEWLIDGVATYDAILDAIAAARDHIHMEYYIFCPDHTGTRIRDALIDRARAGIQVRVLLDAVGASKVNGQFLQSLRDCGAEIGWFHPAQLWNPFKRPWLNLRNHRKIVVVDGCTAFVGGINITDDQNEAVNPHAYRDLHMRIRGEIVRSIQLVFIEDWLYSTRAFGDLKPEKLWPRDLPSITDGSIHAQTLVSGPDTEWENIHRLHVAAISNARKRVWLATPYFVPGEAARMALTSAALMGLDTRLLIPHRGDSLLVTLAARSYFDELLQAGVQIFEYHPCMLHTKALLVDDDICIAGSANFDHRSFRLNFEISMLVHDHAVATRLADHLETRFAEAERVPTHRRTSLWSERLPEAFARLLSPLL